jgi:nucleotide-binding universal stress UspA family protein
MPLTVLLCTDGSELARAALAEGLAVLGPADRVVVATVVDAVDPTLVVGTGMAGGVISPELAQREIDDRLAIARQQLATAAAELGVDGAEQTVLSGAAGPALCDLATELPASVMVIGTRGHGGLRRAVLGSVSDHVVRHAPCPVVTCRPAE